MDLVAAFLDHCPERPVPCLVAGTAGVLRLRENFFLHMRRPPNSTQCIPFRRSIHLQNLGKSTSLQLGPP